MSNEEKLSLGKRVALEAMEIRKNNPVSFKKNPLLRNTPRVNSHTTGGGTKTIPMYMLKMMREMKQGYARSILQ